MRIRQLIVGGGAIDDALARELVGLPIQRWSTYGITETLSHIALRRLNGPEASGWYTPFAGVMLSQTAEGCLVIDAPQVCRDTLITNDIAELAPDGRFRIIGRKDNVICSGGIKIQAEELERQLQPHISVPFMISKKSDSKFGQAVVLLTEGDIISARIACQSVLPKYHQPRVYIHVDHLPLTATGKPARREAEMLCADKD
jgi:O-succinylbenzoic acid--CoA ligase